MASQNPRDTQGTLICNPVGKHIPAKHPDRNISHAHSKSPIRKTDQGELVVHPETTGASPPSPSCTYHGQHFGNQPLPVSQIHVKGHFGDDVLHLGGGVQGSERWWSRKKKSALA